MNKNIVLGSQRALECSTLGQYFFRKLENINKNQIAILDESIQSEITYNKLHQTAILLAKNLLKLKIEQNDVATIISLNSWEFVAICLACFYLHITINPLNAHYSAEEIKHLLTQTQPKIVFCTSSALSHLEQAITDSTPIIVNIDAEKDDSCKHLHLKDLLQDNTENVDGYFFTPALEGKEDDTAIILTSSGTTGLPKAVMISHANAVNSMMLLKTIKFCNENNNKPGLAYLPMCHCFGLIVALHYLSAHIKMIVFQKFQPDSFLQAIDDYKIDHIFMIAQTIGFLTQNPLIDKYNLKTVKYLFSAAAIVPKELQEKAELKFGKNCLWQGYGLTEACGFVTTHLSEATLDRGQSVGQVLLNHEIVVVDKKGNYLGANQTGEFRIKGRGVVKGYKNNKKANEELFDENGYLKTGDLGYYDDNGLFYVVDRIKDIIRYKGFQVSPTELESVLMRHAAIKDAAVIGIADERAGEVPLAFVVPNHHLHVTEKEIVDYVKVNISLEKHLRGGVRFIDEIPRNGTGKILRKKLRELI